MAYLNLYGPAFHLTAEKLEGQLFCRQVRCLQMFRQAAVYHSMRLV